VRRKWQDHIEGRPDHGADDDRDEPERDLHHHAHSFRPASVIRARATSISRGLIRILSAVAVAGPAR
jgi:hypothetical protein